MIRCEGLCVSPILADRIEMRFIDLDNCYLFYGNWILIFILLWNENDLIYLWLNSVLNYRLTHSKSLKKSFLTNTSLSSPFHHFHSFNQTPSFITLGMLDIHFDFYLNNKSIIVKWFVILFFMQFNFISHFYANHELNMSLACFFYDWIALK